MGNVKDRLGKEVPQHDGTPCDPTQVFFGATHASVIGPIMSAHSDRSGGVASKLTGLFTTATCSYVGRSGIVVHQQRGGGEIKTRIVRFTDVEEIPDKVFKTLPGGPKLQRAARAAWQRELLRRRVDKSMTDSEFLFALGYQPAT